MARNAGTYVENNFSVGLLTEATGLTFPSAACKETLNCVHNNDGSISRRLGIDIETNFATKTIDREGAVVVSYLWKNVAGSPTTQLVVLQVGNTLYFYDGSTTDPLSSKPITDNIDLTDFSPVGFDAPATKECQFADGNGLLFVTHPDLEAFYVSYDENTQTFTATQIDIQIRDFKGLEDGYAVDERPVTSMGAVSNEKKYNLANQGWSASRLTTWDSGRTDLPSNVDVAWSFKNSDGDFSLGQVSRVDAGNSPAPKGHFVLDLYDQDRATVSGYAVASEVLDSRCSTVAFYAGRVFYAGLNVEKYNSSIFFSQIVERESQYGECYQVNDPTAETLFDLLPSDGGVIVIRECGNIIKMASIGTGLYIFASNGVWLISGSTGLGFTSNDYSVVKISNTSSLTSSSFVEVQGTMSWWNLEGIHTLQLSQGSSGTTESLTEKKIKQYYNTIPTSAKRRATGFYNAISGVVQWLYREEESATPEELYEATTILNLNVNTGAFYIWKPSESDIKINAVVVLEHRGGAVSQEAVLDENDDPVLDDLGDPVYVYIIENSVITPKFKYICSYPESTSYEFTIAEASDTDYLDWASYEDTGINYSSTFTTGYSLRGEANKDFQSNYITFYADEVSKYKVQGLWEFSNTGNSGRWSSVQIIDNTDKTNYDYIPSKRKIRGQGKSLQIKINSVEEEPFNISGWAVFVTGNTVV